MKIWMKPQIAFLDNERFFYEFSENKITATYKDITDTFDFTYLPDGHLENVDETILERNPIRSARKENGVLFVELLNLIGTNAAEETKHPQWIDHTEYVLPVVEEVLGNGTNEMAQMKWKSKEEIEADKLAQEEEQRKQEQTPTKEERIKMLEQAIMFLAME